MRALLEDDTSMVTWAWSSVEVASAIERRAREGALDREQRRDLLHRLARLAESWHEVTDTLAVRRRAIRLLARHPLRAADAGQLAAALLIAPESGPPLAFVCCDHRLADAAEREGLHPLPPPGQD
ncbi:hypothetical protein [Egibacter rhizosphaerae]|nr:hypothetical protein [Egibacter rhizosphaerae]